MAEWWESAPLAQPLSAKQWWEEAPPVPGGGVNQRAGEFATGANDALAGLVGLPMDASAWLGNKFGQGINYATGSEIFTPRPTIGGSEQIKRGLEATVGRTEPTDTTGRLLYGAGQGVGGTVGGAGLGLGLQAAGRAPAVANALIGGNTAGQQAVNAGLGVASGVGEAVGQEIAGPWGGVAGGLIGGLAPVGLYAGGRAAADRLGATPRAARELQGAAGDAATRQAAIDRLGQETMGPFPERVPGSGDVMAPGEIVPGSLPSTSQITRNTGIGDLERRLITQMPSSADQRTLQQNQLWSLAETQRQAREDLRAGMGSGVPVEERGERLRAPVLPAMERDRAAASKLFEEIDPGKTATFDATPIQTAAGDIRKSMAPTEVSMSEAEKKIFDFVGMGGKAVPFERWQTTRRDLLAEMATQRGAGNSIAVQRMGNLLESVEDTMAGAASQGGNLPPEVAQRYREAADSWRQYKETYQDNPYVGPMVERTPRNALEMQRADVPRQVLQNADSAQAYIKAGGDPDQLRTALVDELAERLPGNKLTPASFFNWLGTREGALRTAGLDSGAGGLNAVRQLQAEFERPLPPGSTMTGRATQRTATTVASKVGDAFRKAGTMVGAGTGAVIGSSVGPVGTFVGAMAPPILNALQKSGINSKDKLLARAAVDPDFARLLLMRETPDNAPLIARGFEAWARTGIGGAAYAPGP